MSRASMALLLLLEVGCAVSDPKISVNIQMIPCSSLPRPGSKVLLRTSTIKPQPTTVISWPSDNNTVCLSCPGEAGKATDACHTWGCSLSDRNGLFFLNESTTPGQHFTIYTYPNTTVAPTGKGLMAPGQCLVPSNGGSFMDTVQAKECGDTTLADREWIYNQTSQSLKHAASGLCLDAGTQISLDCWSASSPNSAHPMCNPSLSAEARAKDFVSRLTLTEKGQNLGGAGGWGGSQGVPRLGVTQNAALQSSEALHGLEQAGCGATTYHPEFKGNNTGCPVSFPHALALGATFNRSLWGLVGDRISTEARAMHNTGHSTALWLWAPDINLFKDPRWGRGQEVPGEDPFLNGEYAMRWISAFQHGIPATTEYAALKALPGVKHAAAYDLENWGGFDRDSFNAIVSDQDLVQYYWPAWRAAIEGADAASVMCSYNAVNGVPSCAHGEFLNDVMRDAWGFGGFVVSDCGAIDNVQSKHHYTSDPDHTVAATVLGGCDADCPGGNHPVMYFTGLAKSVTDGTLPEAALDQSLVRLWSGAISLGLIDDPTKSPFADLGMADVDTPETRALNLEAAVQSMVLLKNEAPADGRHWSEGRPGASRSSMGRGDGAFSPPSSTTAQTAAAAAAAAALLPIDGTATIALIGPHFNATQNMLSNYDPGHYDNTCVSPLQAAQELLGDRLVGYAQGCGIDGNDTSGIAAAVSLAKSADVAVVFVGLTPNNDPTNSGTPAVYSSGDAFEGEGHDRTQITLQGEQEHLISQVLAANPKTVVVLIHGGALAIPWTKSNVPAILDAHYPGQQGGTAVWKTLLNLDGAAPAGRITTTIYDADFVNHHDMNNMALDNITYMHYSGKPLWEFGFGLSYSRFNVTWHSSGSSSSVYGVQTVTTTEMAKVHREYYKGRGRSAAKGSVDLWHSPAMFTATVMNTGTVASDYVVLGFISSSVEQQAADPGSPIRELFDFARVPLAPGASTTVHLSVSPAVLSQTTASGEQVLRRGNYKIELGGKQLGDATDLVGELRVTGENESIFSLEAARQGTTQPI